MTVCGQDVVSVDVTGLSKSEAPGKLSRCGVLTGSYGGSMQVSVSGKQCLLKSWIYVVRIILNKCQTFQGGINYA